MHSRLLQTFHLKPCWGDPGGSTGSVGRLDTHTVLAFAKFVRTNTRGIPEFLRPALRPALSLPLFRARLSSTACGCLGHARPEGLVSCGDSRWKLPSLSPVLPKMNLFDFGTGIHPGGIEGGVTRTVVQSGGVESLLLVALQMRPLPRPKLDRASALERFC